MLAQKHHCRDPKSPGASAAGAFSELRRRALRGQVKFSSGGPPLLSRCRRRQVSFARRTTRGARPAVRTALAPCLSPKALATSLWPMSALWTPVAPQGLALPPPCYRGVWLPGTSAQCRKSAVPLSLRLVSLAPRLPCLCSRGPFRTLCGSLGWMRGVSGSHLAGGLIDRGVPSTPEGMPPQCEARRWHSEARRTGRARCRLCVMCSNVPCGGAFGQKGGVPLHLASLDEPPSAPPLPRAIEGIAARLATTRHPPCPHFARAPPLVHRACPLPGHHHQCSDDGTR
jgi:hypothetical protein